MAIARKVAESASAGHVDNFDEFWPSTEKRETKKEGINFDTDEYKKWYAEMKIKNNIT